MKLYVVLSECGEYSDRDVWVSGVYDNHWLASEEAERAAIKRRIYDQWASIREKHWTALRELMHTKAAYPMTIRQRQIYNEAYFAAQDKLREEAIRLAGPEPECPRQERYEIVEVELNKWVTNDNN